MAWRHPCGRVGAPDGRDLDWRKARDDRHLAMGEGDDENVVNNVASLIRWSTPLMASGDASPAPVRSGLSHLELFSDPSETVQRFACGPSAVES